MFVGLCGVMVCAQEKDESDNYHEAAISRSGQGRVGVCDHHSKGNLAKVSSERQEKNRNKCNIHNITSSQGNHPGCHMYPKTPISQLKIIPSLLQSHCVQMNGICLNT